MPSPGEPLKALILCNDFAPLSSAGAQRPYSWFRFWSENGVEPTVVTKNWAAPSAEGGPSRTIDRDDLERRPEGRVYRVRHRPILFERFLRSFGAGFLPNLRKALTMVEQMASFLSLRLDRHANLYWRARRCLQEEPFDVVITTGEPFILFRYGWLLRREFGVRWVADYRDGWFFNHVRRLDRSAAVLAIRNYERLFERKYVAKADLVTAAHPILARRLEELHGRRVSVAYNGFWEYLAPAAPLRTETLLLTHVGTLTPGQRVEVLLEALKDMHACGELGAGSLEARFLGLEDSPRQVARLQSYDPDSARYVTFTRRIDGQEALLACAASDILLCFTEPEFYAIYVKAFDYLAARRPIAVIPDDGSSIRDFVAETRAGVALSDAAAVRAFLVEKLREKRSKGTIKAPDIDEARAGEYTRARQAARFAGMLKALVEK